MLNHQIIFLTVGILVSFIRCLMIQYIHLIREAYQPRNIYYLLQIRIFLLLFMNKKYGNIMDFFQNLLGKGYAYGTDLFLKNDTFSLYSFLL